ncbi:MAG: 50S ribosomal protein L7/L12 [Caldilineae bacterium]|nr:MAG: 50S ribosomal protein L7/L12 [Caldilineae bacterium]
MADLEKLVEQLSELTLLEAAELTKMLEEKWGVSAAAPVAVAAAVPGAAGAAAEAEEEKTEFDVVLKGVGPKKIQVIKAVRALRSDLGLKEAKAVVDEAPSTILEGVSKEEAEEAKAKLEAEGAEVEIK